MTLLDEHPSGKVCISYQKRTVVDAIDEIMATAQRIPNLDIAKVCYSWHGESSSVRCNLPGGILAHYVHVYLNGCPVYSHVYSKLSIWDDTPYFPTGQLCSTQLL